ncbi:MAG TPA: leucine-rich repeat domain-containing protein, partial [Negativicutes bacterium]|nr:leucine-rich repeat domain-containing protein [Negativicutes bacterium]
MRLIRKTILTLLSLLFILAPNLTLAEGDYEEGDGWEYRNGVLTIIADGGLVDFLENEPDQDQARNNKHFGYDVSELVIGNNVNEFRMFQFVEDFCPQQITVEKGNLNFIVTDGWLIDTRTGTLVCPSDFEAFQTIQMVNDIPDCVRYVGEYAFYPHNYLKEIFIPESVIGLEKFSLAGCEALKIVDLPTHLETINAGAFLGCTTLDEIQLGKQVKFIGEFAFEGCYYLERLNLMDTRITVLSNSLFCNCTELRSIILPETLKTIESDSFKYCSSLESVVISSE